MTLKKAALNKKLFKALISDESLYKNENQFEMFFNQCFDKGRLKNFVLWFLAKYGENKTVDLVEQLKNVGFYYASKAGISLGIDDLKIPPKKAYLIYEAEKLTSGTIQQYLRGEITGVERFQRLIDTWHRTSEVLKQEVIDHFEETDVLNPVYMMAFSGARGNISQVRQLVGMRGLMADPQGQILDFPIRSNFREGLTLTEYIISSYGARKGIVDTALRTANAGYLTRRLVDVAQHVIISNFDCGTKRGIFLTHMKEGNKIINSLSQRIVGRILARDLFINNLSVNSDNNFKEQESGLKIKIASRNEEITSNIAFKITNDKIFVRSSLTCEKLICQLCYGWSLAQGKLVSIGEAVGVVAAQSIGEPGTQLTMRTFHTGGVFSGDISDQIKAPFNGIIEYNSGIPGTLIRTPEGKISFLTKSAGSFLVKNKSEEKKHYKIPAFTILYMRNGQNVFEKEVIAQISSISQKTNATDVVEFTIKSEMEGQFYSKSLGFRERMVGPKLKKMNLNPLFYNLEYDMIYEAWTWGYAWILSGKIYELEKPSLLFPILGDLLSTKSVMTQTKWSLNYNSPYKQQTFRTSSQLVIATNFNTILFEFIKRTPTNSYLKFITNEKKGSWRAKSKGGPFNLSKNQKNIHTVLNNISQTKQKRNTYFNKFNKYMKSYPLKASQILFFDANKITYKRYGYTLEISKKNPFFWVKKSQLFNKKNELYNQYSFNYFVASHKKTFVGRNKEHFDLIFFIKFASNSNFNPIFDSQNTLSTFNLLSKTKLNDSKIKQSDSNLLKNKEKIHKKNPFLPKTYIGAKQFPYFLQWFPDKFKTKTPGVAIFENFNFDIYRVSKNSEISSVKQLKSKQPTFLLSQIKMQFDTYKKVKTKNHFLNVVSLKQHLLFKERLTFLKKPKILPRIFWLTSYIFKFSNLITYSNFLNLYSSNRPKYKNFTVINPIYNIQSNVSNIDSFINIFLHKKIALFKTNRQGQNILYNTNFGNNKNYLVKIKQSNFYKSFNHQNHFLFFKNTDLSKQNFKNNFSSLNFICNTNKNIYNFTSLESYCNLVQSIGHISPNFFIKNNSFDFLSNTHLTKKSKSIIKVNHYKNLLISKNRSLFLLKTIYNLSPFLSFKLSNLVEFEFFKYKQIKYKHNFINFLKSSQIYKNFNFINRNSFLYANLFLANTNNINNNNIKIKKIKNLSILNSKFKYIKNLKSLYDLKTKEFILKSKMYFIKKTNINSLNLLLNKNTILRTPNLFILSKDTQIKTITINKNQIKKSFSFRAFNQIWYSLDYCVSPFKSYFILKKALNSINSIKNKKQFHNLKNSSLAQQITRSFENQLTQQTQNSQTKNIFYTILKKGWVFVLPSYVETKCFFELINKTQNIIYPGQHLYSNIRFNHPIITESLLLTKVFNIINIKTLSNNHMLNLNHLNFEFNQLNVCGPTNFMTTNKKLNWIKNKKSRFYLKVKDYNKTDFQFQTHPISVSFLIQPIQEYQQLDNFEIKNYIYDYNKTSLNLLHSLKNNTNFSKKKAIQNKKKLIRKNCKSNIKTKDVTKKKIIRKNSFFNTLKTYKSELIKNPISSTRFWFTMSKQVIDKQNTNKKWFEIVNLSFDSLLKKRGFQTKYYSTKPNFNTFNTKNQNNSIYSISLYKWQKNILVFNYVNFLNKNKNLIKQIKFYPNFFLNKTFFKKNDWEKIGLFEKSFYNTNRSSLLAKQLKEEFNILSNLLMENFLQQYSNLSTLSNKSPLLSTNIIDKIATNSVIMAGELPSSISSLVSFGQNAFFEANQNTFSNKNLYKPNLNNKPFFIYSRKSLNLASFLITYKNVDKIPINFTKKTLFKLSYLPISNFDLALNPMLSTKIHEILNSYLIESLIQKTKKHTNIHTNTKIKHNYSPFLLNKQRKIFYYSTFTNLIPNLFETPCFNYYLIQTFDSSFLTTTKEQSTQFFYVKHSIPFLTTLLQKNLFTKKQQNNGAYKKSKNLFWSQADAQTNHYSPFNGELIYTQNKLPLSLPDKIQNNSIEKLPILPFNYGCMFLTKQNLISYYLPSTHMHKKVQTFSEFFKLQTDSNYKIKEILIKFLTMTAIKNLQSFKNIRHNSLEQNQVKINTVLNLSNMSMGKPNIKGSAFRKANYLQPFKSFQSQKRKKMFNFSSFSNSTSLLGDFYIYGDTLTESTLSHEQKAIRISGQIIHYNLKKVTLRRAQPILISPKGVLHKLDNEFIDPKTPVITLSYEKLKTGDIIQGIPKVEQFFEARTTKRGRLFRDSLPSLLKALFQRYQLKMSLELAVRQSFYKIQQIIVDGVHRVYKSQGVTISDKHLEVIVKQMTSKVRILDGAQTGFFTGEIVDIHFVEKINQFLIKKITYEPLVLGITKASLEVDSFLSAASFQQTTKVLSQAAIYRKKDFLKGLKENVILGNLIPAGTGYLVYVDDLLLKKEF